MKSRNLRLLMNLWPPYRCAGIRVREIAPDYRYARVELLEKRLNRNYVGTHFGGSLFAMTDPFYMLMYLHNLGVDYVVWDQAARIEYLRPARGTISAEFFLTREDIDRAVAGTAGGDKFLHCHSTAVLDAAGEAVARVERTVYFRLKSGRR